MPTTKWLNARLRELGWRPDLDRSTLVRVTWVHPNRLDVIHVFRGHFQTHHEALAILRTASDELFGRRR